MINELRITHTIKMLFLLINLDIKERFDFINKMKIYYVMDEGDEIKNEYDKYNGSYPWVPTEKPIKKDDHAVNSISVDMRL